MGRTGHPVLIIGIGAVAVLAAGSGVALTRGEGPVAAARTTLGPVSGAQVIAADGVARPAAAGSVIGPGEVVTTNGHGNAQLLTRGRITMLGGGAALQVIDGARQQLRTGTAVIDASEGPGVTLEVATDTVVVPAGSATEADRSVSVRIGSLAGPAGVTNGSGRHLTVPALWQAVINGDALPGAATPLQLNDSPGSAVGAAEARAVPELVADDLAMKTLARGIDTTGSSTANAVAASWTGTILPAAPGISRSERVLPVAIADATKPAGGSPQQRYDDVVGWRAEGGSWGVVVHLLQARAAAVVEVLHSLQTVLPVGRIGTVSAHTLGKPAIPSGPRGNPTSSGTPRTTPPTNPGGGTPPVRPPKGGGSSSPTPSPTSGLVGTVVDTLGGVVDQLLSILPLDQQGTSATSPQSASKPTPTPTPTPAPTHSDLLGGLLGGLSGH